MEERKRKKRYFVEKFYLLHYKLRLAASPLASRGFAPRGDQKKKLR